jgi:hypothetical protein
VGAATGASFNHAVAEKDFPIIDEDGNIGRAE